MNNFRASIHDIQWCLNRIKTTYYYYITYCTLLQSFWNSEHPHSFGLWHMSHFKPWQWMSEELTVIWSSVEQCLHFTLLERIGPTSITSARPEFIFCYFQKWYGFDDNQTLCHCNEKYMHWKPRSNLLWIYVWCQNSSSNKKREKSAMWDSTPF